MTEGPARNGSGVASSDPGFGAQATLRSSDIRRPDTGDKQSQPQDTLGTLETGTKLEGVYEVKRLLGKGAMGAVYLVEHTGLGKEFAAKVVGGSRALDPAAVARLRNEARIASSIEHENIVNVTHLGQTTDGTVFIVMELLRGQDLRHRMEGQLDAGRSGTGTAWLPDAEVRAIVEPVLSALGAAHSAGVVHRDLKPDNIFLAATRGKIKPKIVDFGIGKLRASSEANLRLTETGQIIGTPLYMAPEQTRSTSAVDHRADLYSLAVMIFEMVCGRPPFDAGHLFEIVVKHATEPPPDPRTFRADLPLPVAEVILRALKKDPADRYQSAEEMLEAWTAAWGAPAGSITGEHATPSLSPGTTSGAPEARASDPKSSGTRAAGANDSGAITASGTATLPGSRTPIYAVGAIALLAIAVGLGVSLGGSGATPTTSAAPPPVPEPVVTIPEPEPLPVATAPAEPESPPVPTLPTMRHHTITTTPAGAEVLIDGAVVGETPYELEVGHDATVEITVREREYRTERRTLAPSSDAEVAIELRRERRRTHEEDFPGLADR